MPLNPPTPGLRTLVYDGVSTFRGNVNVHPGSELTVPDEVATQLQAQSGQFKAAKPVEKKVPAKKKAARK